MSDEWITYLQGDYLTYRSDAPGLDQLQHAIEQTVGAPTEETDVDYLVTEGVFLIVRGEGAHILRHNDDATEVEYLGGLDGGKYVEAFRQTEAGFDVEMKFEHERLDGLVIESSLEETQAHPVANRGARYLQKQAQARKLREHFKRWASGLSRADTPSRIERVRDNCATVRDTA